MKFINCDECEGLGKIEYICYDCNGSGEGYRAGTSCRRCKGSGVVYKSCEKCNGTGEIKVELDYSIEFPKNFKYYKPNYKINITEFGNDEYCISLLDGNNQVEDEIILTYDILKQIMKKIEEYK